MFHGKSGEGKTDYDKLYANEKNHTKMLQKRAVMEAENWEAMSSQSRLIGSTFIDYSKSLQGAPFEQFYNHLGSVLFENSKLQTNFSKYLENLSSELKESSNLLSNSSGESEIAKLILETYRWHQFEAMSEFITRYKVVLEDVQKNMKSTEEEIAALQKKAEQEQLRLEARIAQLMQEESNSAANKKNNRASEKGKPKRGAAGMKGLTTKTLKRSNTYNEQDSKPPDAQAIDAAVQNLQAQASPKEALSPKEKEEEEPFEHLLFGLPLLEGLKQNPPNQPQYLVPLFIYNIVVELDASGLTQVGLFRIQGDRKRVKTLQNEIDQGKLDGIKIVKTDQNNVKEHILCNILKNYLRQLPEPLCTDEHFVDFTDAVEIYNGKEEQVPELKRLINLLPPDNATLLEFLISFFNRVASNADFNQMPKSNIASMIAPNVLYRKNANPAQILADCSKSAAVFQVLMEYAADVFADVKAQEYPVGAVVIPPIVTEVKIETPKEDGQTVEGAPKDRSVMTKKHTSHRDRSSKELSGIKSPRERKDFHANKPKSEPGSDASSPVVPVLDLPSAPSAENAERDKFQASKVKKSREKKSVGAQSPRGERKPDATSPPTSAKSKPEADDSGLPSQPSPTTLNEESGGLSGAAKPKKAKSTARKEDRAKETGTPRDDSLVGLNLKDGERIRSPKSPRHGAQSERSDRDAKDKEAKEAKQERLEKSPSASPRSPRVGREAPLRRTKSVTPRERVSMVDEPTSSKRGDKKLSDSSGAQSLSEPANTDAIEKSPAPTPLLSASGDIAATANTAQPVPVAPSEQIDASAPTEHIPLPDLPHTPNPHPTAALQPLPLVSVIEVEELPVKSVTSLADEIVTPNVSALITQANAQIDSASKPQVSVQPINAPLGSSAKRDPSPRGYSSLKALPTKSRQGTDDLRTFVSASPRMPVQIIDKPRGALGNSTSNVVTANATTTSNGAPTITPPTVIVEPAQTPSSSSTSARDSKEISADLGTTPVLHRQSFMDKLKLFQELSNRDGPEEKREAPRTVGRSFPRPASNSTHLAVSAEIPSKPKTTLNAKADDEASHESAQETPPSSRDKESAVASSAASGAKATKGETASTSDEEVEEVEENSQLNDKIRQATQQLDLLLEQQRASKRVVTYQEIESQVVSQCRSLLEMLKNLVNSESYMEDIRKIHRAIDNIASLIAGLDVDLANFKDAVKKHILHVHEVIKSGEGESQSTFLIIVSQLKQVLESTKKQIAAQIQHEDKKIKESTSLLKSL